MKIYTNAGNTQTVKLLAAARISGVEIEVVVVKHDGKSKKTVKPDVWEQRKYF